ncbi:type IX secretion system sortase PorU [Flavihumibacter stibioxidans]|uniref:Gingipain domain-containing protein n=1 Tax=Flavihumibacter stibioxidans TaxID=1834163 RepID=A0ABR7M6B5_9BACT|nr:type IX secretion system sortase PorU [Flavihumibacter stibioxidans]MBC6490576.1 hypothetical protein [Flavihumibacter stibioxidans]
MYSLFRFILLTVFFCQASVLVAQRSYSGHSVLASGKWYRLGIPAAGIYKIDAANLPAMGFALPLPADAVKLFGRPAGIPAEALSSPYSDDLTELAVTVFDGGDGQLQAGDYLVFYAPGPHWWEKDPATQTVRHRLNPYTDTAYIYLTTGTAGKRVARVAEPSPATDTITRYQFRDWYEKDLYNLLSSGKEWYGERFLAENSSPVTIAASIPQPVEGSSARLFSTVAARSVGNNAEFDLQLNGAPLASHTIAPVSSSSLDLFARENRLEASFPATQTINLTYRFISANSSAIGWINRFELLADCHLRMTAGRNLDFRTEANAGPGKIARYQLQEAGSATRVWRVSDPLNPVEMATSLHGSLLSFNDRHEKAEEYIAFTADAAELSAPLPLGPVANQDLHAEAIPGMIIVTTETLLPAAERLADWHRVRDGLNSLVLTSQQVYHEFSGGQPDPTAIRDLVKMFYDRAGADTGKRPRYLLLFGDASFDSKNRVAPGQNGVPSYQSTFSLDPLVTYVSDDYFGLLDDWEDINSELVQNRVDIGIGRIPVATVAAANDYIDKIVLYHQPASRGSWRNELSFIADDEDFNLHLNDAEDISATAAAASELFLQQKIYLDAFQQESDAAGSRYPEVNRFIKDQMQKGTLLWNYSGHGGFRRLAEEVVLDKDIADGWQQNGRLPLFITATCDFAPFDNPAIESLGEYLLTKPAAGAIALMTTTRLVFAYSNRIMNANYLAMALKRQPDGRYRSLGEAVRDAKNATADVSGDVFNNRKFTLLGDPAITLAFPRHQVHTTHINGKPVEEGMDTLRALQEITVRGQVTDRSGQVLSGFNGIVYPQVLDQPYERRTLGNDAGSQVTGFRVQDRFIFKGKATVENGQFSFSFVIPKDISYTAGEIRIVYYAMDSLSDAHGATGRLVVAGSAPPPADLEGPAIRAWLNDTSFRDGGLVNDQPLLIIRLTDTSGINVLGNGIGHDITAILDEATGSPQVLNAFFEADTDTYRSGMVKFRLPALEDGEHRMRIKAWDQVNNSNEISLVFMVRNSRVLVVKSAGAWPNPSRAGVRFVFDHNRVDEPLQAILELFSMEGKPVKKISGTIIASGNRSYLEWNGKDDRGHPVPPGMYVYRILIRTRDGREAVIVKKLIRL